MRTGCGMVHSMATTKITITLPDRQLAEIRKRVAAQESASVTGYIQQAVKNSLEKSAAIRVLPGASLQAYGEQVWPAQRERVSRLLATRQRGCRSCEASR